MLLGSCMLFVSCLKNIFLTQIYLIRYHKNILPYTFYKLFHFHLNNFKNYRKVTKIIQRNFHMSFIQIHFLVKQPFCHHKHTHLTCFSLTYLSLGCICHVTILPNPPLKSVLFYIISGTVKEWFLLTASVTELIIWLFHFY